MTNIDKIVKTIWSCETMDHVITCHNWINDLCNKKIITEDEYLKFYYAYNQKWIEITNE